MGWRTVVSRTLALPAVACLVVGVLLGAWGWGQRDEARARILPEEGVEEGGGVFAPSSTDDPGGATAPEVAEVCDVLRSASRVEAPRMGPLDPGGATPTLDTSPAALAAALVSVLDPGLLAGLDGLDRLDLTLAVVTERDAVLAVQRDGGDPAADPDVVAAGRDLGRVLDDAC